MNKDKVYLEGYVVGHAADTLGYKGLLVQLGNLEIVEIDKDLVHKDINEPQKVQVPQFVADWYEENKDDFEGNLFRCAHNIPSTFDGAKLNEFERWFLNASIKAFQILVNMHQFGYTVEKEKRYKVRVKGVHFNSGLIFDETNKKWFFSSIYEVDHQRGYHNRKELEEAGFGEVFNSPLFEVEEVEE